MTKITLILVAQVLSTWALVASSTAGASENSRDGHVTIVEDNKVRAAIVIADNALARIRDISNALRDYIKQITDVELSIVTVTKAKVQRRTPGAAKSLLCMGPSELSDAECDALPQDPLVPGGQDAVLRHKNGRLVTVVYQLAKRLESTNA